MKNVAKINLEIDKCSECPYCNNPEGSVSHYCAHDLKNPGIDVGNGEKVPDFCPFVLQRLKAVYDRMTSANSVTIPTKFLNQIEKKQIDDPNPKFGADHGFKHAKRVYEYGEKFLFDMISHGLNTNNSIQKQQLLLSIAARLHDIGLADSSRNHAIHSSELAKKYLQPPKIDIDIQDACDIAHAIYNHSDGEDTRNLLDAALLLGDKLDVTKERIVRVTGPITAELLKVETVEFVILGRYQTDRESGSVTGVELRYTTSGDNFKVSALSEWPKCISVPRRVAMDFLEVPFKFIVDGVEVDMKKLGV